MHALVGGMQDNSASLTSSRISPFFCFSYPISCLFVHSLSPELLLVTRCRVVGAEDDEEEAMRLLLLLPLLLLLLLLLLSASAAAPLIVLAPEKVTVGGRVGAEGVDADAASHVSRTTAAKRILCATAENDRILQVH